MTSNPYDPPVADLLEETSAATLPVVVIDLVTTILLLVCPFRMFHGPKVRAFLGIARSGPQAVVPGASAQWSGRPRRHMVLLQLFRRSTR